MHNSPLKDKLKNVWAQLPYLPQALRLVWAAAPRWTLAWVTLLVLQGLLPVATVYLTRALVDNLVAIIGTGFDWVSAQPTLLLASLMGGVILLTEIAQSIARAVQTAQSEQVKDYISDLIQAKSAKLDMAFYETPDYYDKLYRASQEASYRPISLLENLGATLQHGITLLAMAAVLMTYSVWLPLLLLVSTLPIFVVLIRHTLRYHQWRTRATVLQRQSWYYNWLLTARDTAAEMRIFALSGHFRAKYQEVRRQLRQDQVRLARNQGTAELMASSFTLLVTAVTLLWMLWQAFLGSFSLGDLTLFYQAFNQGQRLMRNLLEQMSQIYSNSLFLGDLFEFLNMEYQISDPPEPVPVPQPLQQGIDLQNVSFHYPDSQRVALNQFNLCLPAGKITAIVGANGAGKSTLIKLLCRFYDPVNGSIAVDGIDLRQVGLHAWRRQVTVLFQEPVHYNATASQNIRFGDLPANATPDQVEAAAHAAGAHGPIQRLSQGYETVLGKWFGGGELSVGEWQRLALARAFLRQAQLIILDEPTSAMDSWAEADWLGRFRQMVNGRTALIITHRFTTAMQADIIHVMDRGQVVESGTHAALVGENGRYAQSWQAQIQQGGRTSML